VIADTSRTDGSVAFALSAPSISVGPSGSTKAAPATFHTVNVGHHVHAARAALPLSSASPQQIRQVIRDALRDLHDDVKDAVDDDLLEVLGRRLANRG
jgi:hypothetical protein